MSRLRCCWTIEYTDGL